MIKRFLLIFILCKVMAVANFVNPITDICWESVFPITIAGVSVTPDVKDFETHKDRFCFCHGVPPKPGIPISFWEPNKMVEVTKEPYKLIALGGAQIGSATIKNRGVLSKTGSGSYTSFSHVHIYDYPVFEVLGLLTDFSCIENKGLDMCYFSEIDPQWYDDSLANLMNPEAALFANPLAQVACIADCTSSSLSKPLDELFWCAGCHGSLYPFSGTVGAHVGDIQASLLLVQRAIAKLHREGMIHGYVKGDYCSQKYMPIWKKTSYKIQMAYPTAQTSGQCPSLGGTEVVWGAGRSYPFKGEEFAYILWTKRLCCLDALKVAGTAGGAL